MALLTGIVPLPGADRLLAEQASELPQKDELCGPFWGLITLRAAGLTHDGLDQDAVAEAAGSVLSPPPRGDALPPGEPGRDDYRLALPVAADLARAGTAPTGLARAIAELADARLTVVPVSGDWTSARLALLLDALESLGEPVAALANVAMAPLWEPDAGADTERQARYLADGTDPGPSSAWRVGHFVALVGHQRGPGGRLIAVADTYRSRGPNGVHRQPIERVAAALRRDPGAPGGMLLVVAPTATASVRAAVEAAGLQTREWDNGSADAAIERR